MIRAGYLALREVADFFEVDPEVTSNRHEALSVSRSQFDDIVVQLARHGVTSAVASERAWHAYAGW